MRKRLLIIDDEPLFCSFARRVGDELGHCVETVAEATAFKKRYAAFKPNIVIIDLVLPGGNGLELVIWLAEQQAACEVILVSGFSPEFLVQAKAEGEARGLPSITTLSKPIRVSDLRSALS